ncbi:DUF3311 domain-containing protein [Streptomyces sp. NPDC047108]|uniref:DUF3311 domain-containing protein n=1 Tax=Streptomyces sp. NPDC047108 TaxID=3155025 RepID=UPI003404D363
MLTHRPHLLWLLVPYVLFLGAVPFVNRAEPAVLGLPFLFVWLLGATLVTPVAVWLAWRGDRRAGRAGRTSRTGRGSAGRTAESPAANGAGRPGGGEAR